MRLRPIKSNMTALDLGDKTILFSYQTPVAYHREGEGFFKTSKKWSMTTTRHINYWLQGADAIEVDQSVLDDLIAAVR